MVKEFRVGYKNFVWPLDRLLNENLSGLKKVMSSLRDLGFSCDETWRKLNQRRDQLERDGNGNDEMTALSEEDLQKVSQIVRSSLDDDRRASIRRASRRNQGGNQLSSIC